MILDRHCRARKIGVEANQCNALPAVWGIVDHSAVARVVKLRSRDAENVQIVDGLQLSDVVVVAGVQTLWDGKYIE